MYRKSCCWGFTRGLFSVRARSIGQVKESTIGLNSFDKRQLVTIKNTAQLRITAFSRYHLLPFLRNTAIVAMTPHDRLIERSRGFQQITVTWSLEVTGANAYCKIMTAVKKAADSLSYLHDYSDSMYSDTKWKENR